MSHIYQDNSYYFLTTSIREHKPVLDTVDKKQILLNKIIEVRTKFYVPLHSYSIADNHYHCLFYLEYGRKLFKIVQGINGGSSFRINKLDNIKRSLWDNYWSVIIRSDDIFYKVLGYIIGNPLKHGVVKNFKELEKYPFCNYKQVKEKFGQDVAEELVNRVIDLELEDGNDFQGNLENLKKLKYPKLTKVRQ